MSQRDRDPGQFIISRRNMLRGTAVAGGALAFGGLLSACGGSNTTRAVPTAAEGVGEHGWTVTDQFYTLNNAYFQGWSQGSEEAAAVFRITRKQQVDEFNNEKVIAMYQAAPSQKVNAISSMLADPGISPEILRMAQRENIFTVLGWNLAPWTTPFDIGDKFYTFVTPNNIVGAQTLAEKLFKKMGGAGELIHITGVPGNSVDITRTVGVDAALKKFPNINMVARQPGEFDRGSTTPVIESLLTAHPNVKGIFCQNDDSAVAVVNALNARGMTVPVTGIDAIPDFLKAMQSRPEVAFATWAHHGAWLGAALMVKAYDALAGVKLSASERMMFSGGFIVDTDKAADAYQKLMYSGSQFPFDYAKMSKALHPDDWDPQNLMAPIEFESYFALQRPKPAGYVIPEAYRQAYESGELDRTAELYRSHYKSDPFADVRKLCGDGGAELSLWG
ncbi:sugar ABC transporter substrate-binding protein [Mycobacterium sp. 4D054]|uniref:sugar ABC transporter substrate-binding protein n=1 Tax=Mycobacterium sp. 4D054 TaxID=3457440 RepID=UPI003FD19F56